MSPFPSAFPAPCRPAWPLLSLQGAASRPRQLLRQTLPLANQASELTRESRSNAPVRFCPASSPRGEAIGVVLNWLTWLACSWTPRSRAPDEARLHAGRPQSDRGECHRTRPL